MGIETEKNPPATRGIVRPSDRRVTTPAPEEDNSFFGMLKKLFAKWFGRDEKPAPPPALSSEQPGNQPGAGNEGAGNGVKLNSFTTPDQGMHLVPNNTRTRIEYNPDGTVKKVWAYGERVNTGRATREDIERDDPTIPLRTTGPRLDLNAPSAPVGPYTEEDQKRLRTIPKGSYEINTDRAPSKKIYQTTYYSTGKTVSFPDLGGDGLVTYDIMQGGTGRGEFILKEQNTEHYLRVGSDARYNAFDFQLRDYGAPGQFLRALNSPSQEIYFSTGEAQNGNNLIYLRPETNAFVDATIARHNHTKSAFESGAITRFDIEEEGKTKYAKMMEVFVASPLKDPQGKPLPPERFDVYFVSNSSGTFTATDVEFRYSKFDANGEKRPMVNDANDKPHSPRAGEVVQLPSNFDPATLATLNTTERKLAEYKKTLLSNLKVGQPYPYGPEQYYLRGSSGKLQFQTSTQDYHTVLLGLPDGVTTYRAPEGRELQVSLPTTSPGKLQEPEQLRKMLLAQYQAREGMEPARAKALADIAYYEMTKGNYLANAQGSETMRFAVMQGKDGPVILWFQEGMHSLAFTGANSLPTDGRSGGLQYTQEYAKREVKYDNVDSGKVSEISGTKLTMKVPTSEALALIQSTVQAKQAEQQTKTPTKPANGLSASMDNVTMPVVPDLLGPLRHI